MTLASIIGSLAAIFTTVGALPQVIKVVRTQKTRDISLYMYLITTTGVAFWLIYGLMISDIPLIAANAVTFVFVLIVLIYKLKYK